MADIGSFDFSSYPKPQPQANNPLSMLTDVAKMQSAIGELEVGKGVQQAMGPDGQIDRNKLATFLGQSPAGASKAIPTLDALEKLKSAGFAADATGLDTLQKRLALTSHMFSGIAEKGDKATMAEVHKVARTVMSLPGAKELGIDLPLILNITKQFHGVDGKPLSGKEIAKKALELTTQAASSAEILGQHSPQYGTIDDGQNINFVPLGTKAEPKLPAPMQKRIPPTTPVAGPEGQPRLYGEQGSPKDPNYSNNFKGIITGSEAGPVERADLPPPGPQRRDRMPIPDDPSPATPQQRMDAAYGTAKGPAVANPPGFDTATQAETATSTARASALSSAAAESPNARAIIGNLEKELKNFTPGPGADYKRIFKSAIIANAPIPASWKKEGAVFDERSVASQEEFNKQVHTLVQSQFKALGGTGTDAKLDSAMHTSPNELMSQQGIKGILSLLKGNEDAITLKNKEWRKWREQGKGPQTYLQFEDNFNSEYDPRVFQFKYLKPKERQEYFDKIENADERKELLRKVQKAHDNKWVTY